MYILSTKQTCFEENKVFWRKTRLKIFEIVKLWSKRMQNESSMKNQRYELYNKILIGLNLMRTFL